MKIYVITQGEYSDYRIVATFLNEDVAYDFAKLMNSKIKGYSQDYSVEAYDILSTIDEYKPNTEYLCVSYRSDTKQIDFKNSFSEFEEWEDERKTIYFYSKGFYIAIMNQPLTVKNLLGAEKIMMDWVSQIEYELQNTFKGDLKAYEKHCKNAPF